MTAAQAIELVLQILALFPQIEAAAVQAITDLKALFDSGATVTQADIDAIINRIKAQSEEIQKL